MNYKIKNSTYHDTFPRQAFLERRFLSHPFLLVEKRDILRTASSFFNSDIFMIIFREERVSRYAEQIFDKEQMGFPTPLSSYIYIIPKLDKNVKFFSKLNCTKVRKIIF